jgi:hypothetical protein
VNSSRSFLLAFLILCTISIAACGLGHNPPKTLEGIFVHPRSASAYSNSNQSQVVYSVVAGYTGADDVPITSGIDWQILGSWVSFDPSSGTATCMQPAPPDNFLMPKAATVQATATVEGKTFSDTGLLYCL